MYNLYLRLLPEFKLLFSTPLTRSGTHVANFSFCICFNEATPGLTPGVSKQLKENWILKDKDLGNIYHPKDRRNVK